MVYTPGVIWNYPVFLEIPNRIMDLPIPNGSLMMDMAIDQCEMQDSCCNCLSFDLGVCQ